MLKNTILTYGTVARLLHWLIGFSVIGIMILGTFMGDLPDGPSKGFWYGMHKSFGVTVLFLMGLRLIWKLINITPAPLASHTVWEVKLARAVHWAFYIILFVMPLSGWALSSAFGRDPSFFGLFTLPGLVPVDKERAEFYEEIHEIGATVVWVLLGLHIAGALKHAIIDKDNTIRRMVAGD